MGAVYSYENLLLELLQYKVQQLRATARSQQALTVGL
jgi:hypothetical protein